jgi:hypothetical protein
MKEVTLLFDLTLPNALCREKPPFSAASCYVVSKFHDSSFGYTCYPVTLRDFQPGKASDSQEIRAVKQIAGSFVRGLVQQNADLVLFCYLLSRYL